jgi:hypothetical protein
MRDSALTSLKVVPIVVEWTRMSSKSPEDRDAGIGIAFPEMDQVRIFDLIRENRAVLSDRG